MNPSQHVNEPDVILIGSGIMSATLGAILKRLEPRLSIQLYEGAAELACESSNGWNNAGTGHAGICELSYTPHRNSDGSVRVSSAIETFAKFALSKQFWSFAVSDGMIDSPKDFIATIPHVSFVHGEEQIDFLRARYEAMSSHHFFKEMEFSTDRSVIARWAPLLVEGRGNMLIAATRMEVGTDINFGTLSRKLLAWLSRQSNSGVACSHSVVGLDQTISGWQVLVKDHTTSRVRENRARYVFIGAGGGTLPLLQKSGIAESKGIGGFPIGGQWLICENSAIVDKHHAKVYGQALDAAPTMAVPHLDTRILDGKRALLFGPFAAWTTKFLRKMGAWTDLPQSVRMDNIGTLFRVAVDNLDLIRYLIQQGAQSATDRINTLRIFYPAAKLEDWRLIDAGIRVQAIKKSDADAGIVHYGTEVVTNAQRNISALLGASPGASLSVSIALDVLSNAPPDLIDSSSVQNMLQTMVPSNSYDAAQADYADSFSEISARSEAVLQLG